MDEDFGGLIGILIVIAIAIFVIYCILVIASVIAAAAGAGGVLWGGGTALVNYYKSFRENMIDSNFAAA